jgi:hypothetical protein
MRVRWRAVLWLAVAAAEAWVGPSGHAQSTDTNTRTLYQDEGTKLEKSNKMWNQNDTCGRDSFRKYPDYTAEAAVKRDAFMRDCLRKHNLPPRNDLVPRRP